MRDRLEQVPIVIISNLTILVSGNDSLPPAQFFKDSAQGHLGIDHFRLVFRPIERFPRFEPDGFLAAFTEFLPWPGKVIATKFSPTVLIVNSPGSDRSRYPMFFAFRRVLPGSPKRLRPARRVAS